MRGRVTLEALAALWCARVALWVLPYRRVQRWYLLEPLRSPPLATSEKRLATSRAVAYSLSRASRLVLGATCLPQAFAARRLLMRRGVACDVRFGVARAPDGRFDAHAWVEVDARVVIGDLPDLERFSRLPEHAQPG